MTQNKREPIWRSSPWRWYRVCIVIFLSMMIMVPVLSLNVEAKRVTAIGLGTLGGAESFGNDVNNRGQVVGMSFTAELPYNNWHSFSWTMKAGMVDLNPFESYYSQAKAVNDRGDVVGYYMPPSAFYDQACLWGEQGKFVDLGSLWGGYGTASYARDINNNGLIVGIGYTYEELMSPSYLVGHALIWTKCASGYKCQDIGTLPGGDMAWAYGANDRNEVVGISATQVDPFGPMEYHAFIWRVGKGMTDLGQLGDVNQGLCAACDINNKGQVVGHDLLPDYNGAPTIEDRGFTCGGKWGGMDPVRTPNGYVSSYVQGINDRGDMVGGLWLDAYYTGRHAALWPAHGSCIDLGTLPGGYDSYAKNINARGIVVGTSSGTTDFGWGYQATIWCT